MTSNAGGTMSGSGAGGATGAGGSSVISLAYSLQEYVGLSKVLRNGLVHASAVDSTGRLFVSDGDVVYAIKDGVPSIYLSHAELHSVSGNDDPSVASLDVGPDDRLYILDGDYPYNILVSHGPHDVAFHLAVDNGALNFPGHIGAENPDRILVVTASGGLYEITSGGTKQLYAGAAFEDASGCKVLDFAATQAINNGRVQQTREKQNSHAHAFARRDLVKTCSRLVDFVIDLYFRVPGRAGVQLTDGQSLPWPRMRQQAPGWGPSQPPWPVERVYFEGPNVRIPNALSLVQVARPGRAGDRRAQCRHRRAWPARSPAPRCRIGASLPGGPYAQDLDGWELECVRNDEVGTGDRVRPDRREGRAQGLLIAVQGERPPFGCELDQDAADGLVFERSVASMNAAGADEAFLQLEDAHAPTRCSSSISAISAGV